MSALAGHTALVTGAGRGIGQALAVGLAAQGARVVLTARSADQLAETVKLVGRDDTVTVTADLGTPQGMEDVLRTGAAEAVDILVNNAATVAPLGPSQSIDPEEFEAQFRLNVFAVARLTFGLVPQLVASGWGRILNISSGIVANPGAMIGGNAYVSTKAALEGHTLNLATELAGTGITVNVYRPGTVDTAMQDWIREQDPSVIGTQIHQRFLDYKASGALITPEQSAGYVLSLIGGDQTGQIWSYGV